MNKKGFEMQFNWIFILVAGVFILILVGLFISRNTEIAERSAKTNLIRSIESIITSASVSTDITNVVEISKLEIDISCNKISVGGVPKQYQNLILFAPSKIKGSKLITQTLTFSVPYKATNLLYITSPQVRYIIVGDGDNSLVKKIDALLPKDLNKKLYSTTDPNIANIENENNYNIKFIVFGDSMINIPDNLKNMPDKSVTAVRIPYPVSDEITEDDEITGTVEFYKKEGNSWATNSLQDTSPYIGIESLIGAIYSDTVELYNCNMGNTFSRLNLVTLVLKHRSEKLKNSDKTNENCYEVYASISSDLQQIIDKSLNFNSENVNTILSAASNLEYENKKLEKESCPLIY